MKFYNITDSYISFLRQFDSRIYENKSQARPYVGVVLQINEYNYYVSLSSPKPKHRNMSNSKDFRKINGGVYGALNFNYMVPVPESELIDINIANIQDVQYRRLLQNQYSAIKNDWTRIVETAEKLYHLCECEDSELSSNDLRVKQRCCNFGELEQKCSVYSNKSQDK